MKKKKKPYIALLIAIMVLSINQVVDSYYDYQFRCQIQKQYTEIRQVELAVRESQNTILEVLDEILNMKLGE